MKGLMTLRLAIGSLAERPLRSILTSLGIIIGVATVYAMLAFGEAAKARVEASLNSVQTRTFTVWPDWSRARASQSRPSLPFTEQDVIELRAISGVLAATGEVSSRSAQLTYDTNDLNGNLIGVDPDKLKSGGEGMLLGENISFADLSNSAPVAVISRDVMARLFRGQNPIGETIRINNVALIVKGVVAPIQSNINFGNDDIFVWAPITTARERITGGNRFVPNHVSTIRIVGELGADLERIEADIHDILKRSRDVKSGSPADYRLFSSRAWSQRTADETRSITILLAIMGAISLIVGGVGVMNIMLVSVTERTREIGLRMAIGARRGDIMAQFLSEALLLCIISGAIGLAIGYFASDIVMTSMEIDPVFGPGIAIISVGASVLIGLIFGFLPARRAARLNPIEALRHE